MYVEMPVFTLMVIGFIILLLGILALSACLFLTWRSKKKYEKEIKDVFADMLRESGAY